MKKNIVIIVLLFSASFLYSQNLDSLYNAFVGLRTAQTDISRPATDDSENIIKCGFPLVSAIKFNYDKFTSGQQIELKKLMMRPDLDTSIVSPKGLFRIHYNLVTDKPDYSITMLAAAFDSVYNYEINILGYAAPPPDNGLGGDNLYDVYVYNIGGTYGWTASEEYLGDDTWTGHIVIDNDFKGFYTTGIFAASVTAAHEFHHLIQMGNYIYGNSDIYYHEITSTAMEEFVFDSINDYYAYLKSYFYSPNVSIRSSAGSGYDLGIWNIFLKDRFGIDIIKAIWEEMKSLNNIQDSDDTQDNDGDPVAMKAMEKVLLQYPPESTSLKNELNKFGIWCYFTGSRADEGKAQNVAFEEAEYYPMIKTAYTYEFVSPQQSLLVMSEAMSNNFLVYYDYSQSLADTLFCLVTNGDVNGAQSNIPDKTDFIFTVHSDQPSDFIKITDRFSSKLESSSPSFFQQANVFNYELITGDFAREETDYVFPDPFSYTEHIILNIPVEHDPNGLAQLHIYTTAMNLVYSGRKNIIAGERVIVRWDGLDNSGNKLPTGVYIYVTEAGDKIKKGKLVIYNE